MYLEAITLETAEEMGGEYNQFKEIGCGHFNTIKLSHNIEANVRLWCPILCS
jgi:hypothetical protein